MRKLILSLLLVTSLSCKKNTDIETPIITSPTWQLTGLQGITSTSLIVVNNLIYAATAGNGVYSSTNSGQSWTQVNNGLGNSFVFSLANISSQVFAGTRDGIYMTDNNGTSWIAKRNGIPTDGKVYSLLADNNILYGGSADGIFKSTDNGSSWALATTGFTGSPYVYSLIKQNGVLFAGTQENGIMKSTDNGATWASANSGIPAATTIGTLHVISNTTLLAGADGGNGVYISTNSGNSWTSSNNGVSENRIFSIVDGNNAIYAGSQKAVYKSTNNGSAWIKLTTQGLAPDAYINDVLVVGNKIIISTDNGIYTYQDQ